MTINQIKFIKDHTNLIDSNDFDTLYEEASQQLGVDPTWLTTILLESDVNFLQYMSYIPTRCFSSLPITTITIPPNIEYIGGNAFKDCINLKSLKFDEGSNCKEIWSRAFLGCRQLETIELPDSVEKIGCEDFSNCTQLQTFSFSLNLWWHEAVNPFPYPKNIIIRGTPKPGKENFYSYLSNFIEGRGNIKRVEFTDLSKKQLRLLTYKTFSIKSRKLTWNFVLDCMKKHNTSVICTDGMLDESDYF